MAALLMGCDGKIATEKWQSDPGSPVAGHCHVNGLALAGSIIYNLRSHQDSETGQVGW